MKKEECIARYGEAEYNRRLAQSRAWQKEHSEQKKAVDKKYREEHPEEVKANNQKAHQELCRKGGKYYDKHLEYDHTGLRGKRNRIRSNHRTQYRPYKQIIAPDSQLHHEWVPDTSEYRGVALVEKEAHMHGFVDVIEILDGKITLLTEEEVRRGEKREKESLQAR